MSDKDNPYDQHLKIAVSNAKKQQNKGKDNDQAILSSSTGKVEKAMAIIGKEDQRSNSRTPSSDRKNRDSQRQTSSKSQRDDGESLSSSQGSDESLHRQGDASQNAEEEKTRNKSKPVPSSPLVTPPMGSNASPESPRVRGEASTSGVLPPAATAHGFYANPTVDYASRQKPLPPPHTAMKQKPEAGAAVQMPSPPRHASSPKHKQRGVPHVYHDYSQVSGPGASYVRKKTGGVTNPFPEKLHEMLDQESNDDPSSAIVSWLPHGRAFIVRRPKEFTSQIMPKYFRQTKLTSFQRQLNLYGFRRITQGADSGAYYHELFLQGRPSLSQRMVRQKVKGTGHKQPADVSSEPNFYAMSQVQPEQPSETFGAKYKATIMPPTGQPAIAFGQALTSGAPVPVGQPPALAPGNSPGYGSLQGAASLLQGFASSFGAGGPPAAYLGPPAVSQANKAAEEASKEDKKHSPVAKKPASFLPRGEG